MPRRKVSPGRVADASDRKKTLARRTKGLFKAAHDLSELCGNMVAVAVRGCGAWESHPGRVFARYLALPAPERAKHTNLAYAMAELRKEEARLDRARRAGPRALDSSREMLASLDGMAPEELRALVASIDAAVRAAEERRAALLGAHDDGGVVVVPGGGEDVDVVPFVADEVEDMDAWIDELMWDGVQPLPPPKDDTTTQSSGSTSSSGVNGQHYQMQMLGNGGDQQYYQTQQMTGNGDSHDGNGHQYQQQDASPVFPPGYSSSFPCLGSHSSSVNMNGYQSNANNAHVSLPNMSLCNVDDPSRTPIVPLGHVAGSFACPPPTQLLLANVGGDFTGAPAAAGLGRNSIDDANYGCVYQKQHLDGDHYHYFTDNMAGFQMQQQAPASNAGAHDHVWPNLRGADDDWSRDAVVPLGYASIDVAAGSSLFHTLTASSDSFVINAAPAAEVGTACNDFEDTNGFEYDTQCLLLDGDVQCPDATSHCSGLEQQLNHYLSDVAQGFLFRT